MQAWWAEEYSLKNNKNLTVQKLLTVYIYEVIHLFIILFSNSIITKSIIPFWHCI